MKTWLWDAKPWNAFKTFAIIFSFTINLLLLIALFLLAPTLLPSLSGIARPIVGGLNQSFIQMGQAEIQRTIDVQDTIPIDLSIPVHTNTIVTLSAPVPVQVPAQFILPDGGGSIRGIVNLELPPGIALPIDLDLTIPIQEQLPIDLAVDIQIPLRETELGHPFGKLQALFAPLDRLLSNMPADNKELFDRLSAEAPQPNDPSAAANTNP